MRLAGLIVIAFLAACSTGGGAAPEDASGPSPFPVERGTASPPPAASASGQTAPPEGAAAGGVDFGRWRQADPAIYAPAFQTQLRTRYAGQNAQQIRADLERNGFACSEGGRLDCRIEIMERQCAFDWYAVVEPGRSELIAGFDQMCLGARR